MLDQAAVLERRRQILRVVLLVMIFATLPFYCLGFFLWATAPDRAVQEERLPSATFTSIGGGGGATNTQFPTLSTTLGAPLPTLMPTPFQYNPPPIINPPVINPPTATQPFFIPTSTPAPTLTFAPTNTDLPPPSPLPLPSDTPIPTSTTAPSLTPLPADTEVPPDILQPPTDTPGP